MKKYALKSTLPPLYLTGKLFFLCLVLNVGVWHRSFCQNIDIPNLEKPFAYPGLIYGSDFLSVFQTYYKQGDWNMLIQLTSKNSVERIGRKKLIAYFKSVDFGYDFTLRSISSVNNTFLLNYTASIMATYIVIRCEVIIENDTCRLSLPKNVLQQPIFLYK